MQSVCIRTIVLSLQHGPLKGSRILHHVSVRKSHQISTFGSFNNLYRLKTVPGASLAGNVSFRSTSLNCIRTYSQANQQRPQAQSTIDEEEIDKFRALSEKWWDEVGEFQALHTLNDLRIPLIRDAALTGKHERLALEMGPAPLKENLILDVGSGGGILAEPLARLGANVIGIDATEENIPIAQTHASHDPEIQTRLKYIHCTAEDLVATEAGMFDVVVASEVLEHVSDVGQLVSTCVDLVRPGGSIIFTTINKTLASYWIAVVGAEEILRVVPSGTHDWEKFIPPEELERILEQCGCEVQLVSGMLYNPLTHNWSWSDIQSCNYAVHAIKPEKHISTESNELNEGQVGDETDSTTEKR